MSVKPPPVTGLPCPRKNAAPMQMGEREGVRGLTLTWRLLEPLEPFVNSLKLPVHSTKPVIPR